MIQSIRRETIALGLLNTLESERYVRAALLVEFIESLAEDARFSMTLERAHALLDGVERRAIDEQEFVRGIDELRTLVVGSPPTRPAQTMGRASAA
jgi:hypothetical protein